MRRAILSTILASAHVLALLGQAENPRFEVASVRLSASTSNQSIRVGPGRLDYVNVPLAAVLLRAFRIDSYQLRGTPEWLSKTGVDIHATFPGTSQEFVPEMLQALLRERFGLVASLQPRPLEGYNLTAAKDGIKMREVPAADERKSASVASEPGATRTARGLDGQEEVYRTIRNSDGLTIRTVTARTSFATTQTRGEGFVIVDAARITMAEFVVLLRANLDKPVADMTGLSGLYQFRIELAPSLFNLRFAPPRTPTSRSTFKAVESLGLKLEERRLPFDILVIEHMERQPAEN